MCIFNVDYLSVSFIFIILYIICSLNFKIQIWTTFIENLILFFNKSNEKQIRSLAFTMQYL